MLAVDLVPHLIPQELKPVPKPVKVAVLHGFMKQRMLAYIFLLGLYWKVRESDLRALGHELGGVALEGEMV